MMKRTTKTSARGTAGQNYVQGEFTGLLWAVSPIQQEHDVGTDLWLGARDERGFDLGALIGAQVKTGPSYFTESISNSAGELQGWWFRDKDNHSDYWCSHAVPHIVVLHDPETKTSYWAPLTYETRKSTGKGDKYFVSAGNTVDDAHRDQFIELAMGNSETRTWEGSSWEPPLIADCARLRYALMIPRLIAPHPNRGIKELDAFQAIALLVQLRVSSLEQMKDGVNILDPQLLSQAQHWEWRFFAALHDWLDKQLTDSLLECIDQSSEIEQRVAAIACASHACFEQGEIQTAISLLEPELEKDTADPIDHGWLQAHLAQSYLELGKVEEASQLAMKAYRLRSEAATDPTARALAAAASYTLLFANDRDDANLKNAVQGNDTASSWWRSQSLVAGFDRHYDETFDHWAGTRTNYMQDETWRGFRSVMLQSGISADRATWANAASLLARRELMNSEDNESLVWALHLLRLSGNEQVQKKALPRMLRAGPILPIIEVGKALNLDLSTRTSLSTDICFVRLSADVLHEVDCDRHARWGIATLPNAEELEHKLGVRFSIKDAILDMLLALMIPCSIALRSDMKQYILASPVLTDKSNAKKLGLILLRIFEDEWTDADIETLSSRSSADHAEFKDALIELLAPRIPDIRYGLLEKVSSGDLNALANFGKVTDLPADVVASIVTHLTLAVKEQVELARSGEQHLGGPDKLGALVLLNLCHPTAADWSSVTLALALARFDPINLVGAIRNLARLAEKATTDARSLLQPLLRAIADRQSVSDVNSPFLKQPDIRESAIVTLATWFPEQVKDSVLLQQLASEDPIQRAAAVRIVVSQSNTRKSDLFLLAACAKDPEAVVKKASIVGLATWVVTGVAATDSEDVLKQLLEAGEPELGIWASTVIIRRDLEFKKPESLAKMLRSHPSTLVRIRTRLALKRLNK